MPTAYAIKSIRRSIKEFLQNDVSDFFIFNDLKSLIS